MPAIIETLSLSPSGASTQKPAGVFPISPQFLYELPQFCEMESVQEWNTLQLSVLYHLQELNDEGCFFVGLAELSTALYPDRPLPPATEIWMEIPEVYGDYLARDENDRGVSGGGDVLKKSQATRLIRHDRVAEAVRDIFPSWGLQLTEYQLNETGEELIGKGMEYDTDFPGGQSMYDVFGGPRVSQSNKDHVDISQALIPSCVLLNLGGTSDSHFVGLTGSDLSQDMLGDYLDKDPYGFTIVAAFAVERYEE